MRNRGESAAEAGRENLYIINGLQKTSPLKGNPPRATARGEAAGLQGSAVLCARARAGRNTRAAAQRAGRRTQARTNSPTPARLLRDERGARPLAKAGAALPRPPSALGTGGDHASLHPRLHGVASPLQP